MVPISQEAPQFISDRDALLPGATEQLGRPCDVRDHIPGILDDADRLADQLPGQSTVHRDMSPLDPSHQPDVA
jgi:hypothetical protein